MGEGVLTTSVTRVAAMEGFTRIDGVLCCDGVSLHRIAEEVGTPAYVYSAPTVRARYYALMAALSGMNVRVHYSVKANSNLALLRLLRECGAGVDIVSGGELYRSLLAGFTGRDVVFSGVGKTASELEAALRAGVKTINVESPAELDALHAVAQRLGVVAPVALRVNPDVSVETPHPYTRTGEHGMKFGIPDDQVVDLARRMQEMPHVQLVGVAAHIGSQIANPEPYALTAQRLLELIGDIRALGVTSLQYLDIGGGLAVSYGSEGASDVNAFAAAIRPIVERSGLQLLLEPGRYLVADAGALLIRVVYRKHSGGKEIIITDAGMNDLIRPSLYDAYHAIEAVDDTPHTIVADVVGPVCESGDFFGLDRAVADVQTGDLLVIRSAGAYGFVMASNYNTRPRPAEVMVEQGRFAVVTRRETYEDLVRRELGVGPLSEQFPLTWSDA